MSTNKRNRGRPPGTGKDDSKLLETVADMVAADPAMPPTTAMHRVAPNAIGADVRRFQAKWKERREELLKAARERNEARRLAARVRTTPSYQGAAHYLRSVRDAVESPSVRLIRQMVESPAFKLASDDACSAQAKLAREVLKSSQATLAYDPVKAALAVLNSPELKFAREADNQLKALRDLSNSAELRAIREHQNMINILKGY